MLTAKISNKAANTANYTTNDTTNDTATKIETPNRWLSCKRQAIRLVAAAALIISATQAAFAAEDKGEEPKPILWTDQEIDALRLLDERANPPVQIRSRYALGVNRYYLNHATRLIGWQVGESLYFGRAKGEESGIALVWQRRWNQQVSLSNDGIRLTRHF